MSINDPNLYFHSTHDTDTILQILLESLPKTESNGPFTITKDSDDFTSLYHHRLWRIRNANQETFGILTQLKEWGISDVADLFGTHANYAVSFYAHRSDLKMDHRALAFPLMHDLIVTHAVVTEAIYEWYGALIRFQDNTFYANLTDPLWENSIRCFVSEHVVFEESLRTDYYYWYVFGKIEELAYYNPDLLYSGEGANRLLLDAAKEGDLKALQFLSEAGVSMHHTDSQGTNAVHRASGSNNPEALQFLLDLGIDCHAVDRIGRTPLMHAAESKNAECVALLIAQGVYLDQQTKYGDTALTLAKKFNRTEAIEILQNAGANPYA